MATNQTTVNDQKAVQVGSARVEYSEDNGSSFVNLGVGDSFAYVENITPLEARPDNGPTPDALDGIATQNVNVTGNMWEIKLAALNALRGGIDTLSSVASTLVSGASQLVAIGDWEFDKPILLTGQNSDGTVPTINSVTGSVDGAGAADDWTTVKIGGEWYLIPKDGTNFTTENQTLTINTDYTPAASESLSSGGKTIANKVWIRLTNRLATTADAADAAANAGISEGDNIYRTTRYDFYYCKVNTGLAQTFPSKDDTNPVVLTPIDMLAELNADRAVGDQLFKVTRFIELQSSVTI
jgi:hypothetical protein